MAGEDSKPRIQRLHKGMAQRGIDALLCLKPQNSFYLSGFNPIIYSHPVVAILPREGEPMLLVHALRDDHARTSAWAEEICLYGAWSTKVTMGPDWLAALHTILEQRGLADSTLGVEFDFLSVGVMQKIREHLPAAHFVDASLVITETRMVKDPDEIEQIRIAARIADIGMAAALAAAVGRSSEQEISVQAMAAMNRAWLHLYPGCEVGDFGSLEGGVLNGLWCYCLVGDRVALNCDIPTPRQPVEGELALIVNWTCCNGLHAENERTVAFGQTDKQRRDAYEAILRIREEAQRAIRPGATCADVYQAAKVIYERLGYGRYLPGRIGHGMGLGPHEHPSFGPTDQTVLTPGMVMTFEPNLRIAEWGGLQHSDTLLITDDGFEYLTQTERGFIQL